MNDDVCLLRPNIHVKIKKVNLLKENVAFHDPLNEHKDNYLHSILERKWRHWKSMNECVC